MKEQFSLSDEIRTVLTAALAVFITLKLTGDITWPWVWVLSPIWITAIVALVVIGIVMTIALIVGSRS